jgi:hypothetical protein
LDASRDRISHPEVDRTWYAKVLRSQLASHELVVLFYYGLTPAGEKLKALIERYGMLEDIEDGQLIKAGHRGYYQPSAFNTG